MLRIKKVGNYFAMIGVIVVIFVIAVLLAR